MVDATSAMRSISFRARFPSVIGGPAWLPSQYGFSDGSKLTGVIPSLVSLFCYEHLIAALLPYRAHFACDGADLSPGLNCL